MASVAGLHRRASQEGRPEAQGAPSDSPLSTLKNALKLPVQRRNANARVTFAETQPGDIAMWEAVTWPDDEDGMPPAPAPSPIISEGAASTRSEGARSLHIVVGACTPMDRSVRSTASTPGGRDDFWQLMVSPAKADDHNISGSEDPAQASINEGGYGVESNPDNAHPMIQRPPRVMMPRTKV